MGLLATIVGPLADCLEDTSVVILVLTAILALLSISLLVNVASQLLFKDPTKPPVVFHWFPFIGSTISYGIDPIAFFDSCHRKVSLILPKHHHA
jgi:sterol 14-demethylase